MAFDLGHDIQLVGSAGRSRYLWTLASADSLVMMNRAEVRLDRAEAPRWAWEATLRREFFSDDNHVTTAFAWILAPLLDERIRVGYAFSWSDADENRWVPKPAELEGNPDNPGTPPAPGSTVEGRYAPYHTPTEERVHSALAALAAHAGPVFLRLNGSVGLGAEEQAPVLIADGTQQGSTRYFYERSFTPWRVTLNASVPLAEPLSLDARAEAWETAYYEVTEVGLSLTYRFGGEGP
jgi:hypothetical protein